MAIYTKQSVGLGTVPGDGTGDGARTSFTKINDNFDVLFGAFDIDSTTFAANFKGTALGVNTPLASIDGTIHTRNAPSATPGNFTLVSEVDTDSNVAFGWYHKTGSFNYTLAREQTGAGIYFDVVEFDRTTGDATFAAAVTGKGFSSSDSVTGFSIGGISANAGKNRLQSSAGQVNMNNAANAGLMTWLTDRTAILPGGASVTDLGSTALKFKDGFFNGVLTVGTVSPQRLGFANTAAFVNAAPCIVLGDTGVGTNKFISVNNTVLEMGRMLNDGTSAVAEFTLDATGQASLVGGLAFSGDTRIDANLLDDFEKGIFTPVVIGTTAAGVGTYAVQNGKFTKIGDVVIASFQLTWTAHTGTGDIKFGGLPFVSADSNTTGSIRNRLVSIPVGHTIQLSLPTGLSEILYEVFQVDGTDNVPAGKAMESGGDVYVQITYRA